MTQLCVTIPALAAPEGAQLVAQAMASAKIAAIVLVPAPSKDAIEPAAALLMISAGQKAGAAVLVYADAQLARTLRADGVHLPWDEDVRARAEEAREILGQGGIVGAEAGASRHDAMELGEFGVDYVAFSAPEDGSDPDDQHDLVSWWAEIFEVPVVALDVTDRDAAAQFAAAHAEFVGVTLATSDDAKTRLPEIAAAIGATIPQPV